MTTAPLPIVSPPPPPPSGGSGTPPRPSPLSADGALVALGVALLAAATVISTFYSRRDGELDWSNYGVGLAATLGLLGIAAAGRLLVADAAASRQLVSWPASFGAVGAGLMVGVALDDADATLYLSGLVIIALAAGAYVLAPSAPPVLAGVLGLVAVYGQTIDDTIEPTDGDDGFVLAAVFVLVFVLVASGIGWVLPRARVVVGVSVGAFGIVSYLALLAAILLSSTFFDFSAGFDDSEPARPDYDNDVYVILGLSVLLVLLWYVASVLTEHPGYKVLMVAMSASVLPAGMAVLAVDHPSWWGLAVGLVGGLLLLGVVFRSRGATSGTPTTTGPVTGPTTGPPPPYTG